MTAEVGAEPGVNNKQSYMFGEFQLNAPRGLIPGCTHINKFGRATNCDTGILTDIWSRANPTDDQPIWLPPTQARTHQVHSNNVNDTAAGTGARTLKIWGLVDWGSKEVTEIVTMNGTTNVPTNDYVIIHRMKALTWGSDGPNLGHIEAHADVDLTITAEIEPGEGNSQMAIYGIPSTQNAYMTQRSATILKATGSIAANVQLLINPIPDQQLLGYLKVQSVGVSTVATNHVHHNFNPYLKIEGPAIIKMQTLADANNGDVTAGFDLVIVDQQ